MKERITIIGVLVGILVLAGIAYANIFDRQVQWSITFYNDTEVVIEGLHLQYTGDTNTVSMPEFKPDEKYEIRLQPNKEFVEGSMLLFYVDNEGTEHTIAIAEKVRKGYPLNVEARIKTIDEKGILSFDIQE
jgi:hypothetical protein